MEYIIAITIMPLMFLGQIPFSSFSIILVLFISDVMNKHLLKRLDKQAVFSYSLLFSYAVYDLYVYYFSGYRQEALRVDLLVLAPFFYWALYLVIKHYIANKVEE